MELNRRSKKKENVADTGCEYKTHNHFRDTDKEDQIDQLISIRLHLRTEVD